MLQRTLLFFALLVFNLSFCQESSQNNTITTKKRLTALATTSHITIDGELNESEWSKAAIAGDFTMLEPDNGKPLPEAKKTEVKVLYDNEAIYIGAVLNDDEPDKIMREITQRDDDGSADFFGLSFNGYNDGQQEFRFFVTAAGVQLDCNANSQTGEDFSWDAIWVSKAKITDKGWIVEIKLPYSALRFSEKPKQVWGIQFFRQIRRYRQLFTWNYVNNQKGALEQQSGELEGIENIKTPTRLFLFPYASTYVNHSKEDGTQTQVKGGLDIKYGINDAFTLDAILIPDFGQTAFDNKILNLGPFEQQFNENRPFFTEGTDLFNKGNLFYSRRIGGRPSMRGSVLGSLLEPNEEIEKYPTAVGLLNALKVSGRTKDGLGIGILNAITQNEEATIYNSVTGERRKITVEPITNYNITTLDQRFHKNSSVSFVNTNVTRDGIFRDANVSALVFDLNNKKNTFNVGGDFKYSYVNEYGDSPNREGINTSLYFGETAGKVRFNVNGNYISKKFDNNDLGINFQTNFYSLYNNVNYRILKPTKTFNSARINMNLYSEFENTTGRIQGGNINFNANVSTKNNDGMGLGINLRPFTISDFYQARVPGRYVTYPQYYNGWMYYSSNYNRKLAIDFNPYVGFTNESNRNDFGFSFGPRYRFSNKLLVVASYDYSKENNAKGFFDISGEDIIFEQRNINTSTLSLRAKYALNNTMTININSRYYWSYVEHKKYEALQTDGSLINTLYDTPGSQDFSSWNLDCSYSWWISPGSQLNVLYRNNSGNGQDGLTQINKDFGRNFSNLFGDKLNHTFSISLRYFLDYNRVKNWF